MLANSGNYFKIKLSVLEWLNLIKLIGLVPIETIQFHSRTREKKDIYSPKTELQFSRKSISFSISLHHFLSGGHAIEIRILIFHRHKIHKKGTKIKNSLQVFLIITLNRILKTAKIFMLKIPIHSLCITLLELWRMFDHTQLWSMPEKFRTESKWFSFTVYIQ